MFVNLDDKIVKFIRDSAEEYIKDNDLTVPIGAKIFSQLKKVSILLLYPLLDENANGICVTRTLKDQRKKFIFINTNNDITKQIYTAAHEIGHIIEIDVKLKGNIEFNDDPELIINRFASELLMPKDAFIKQFKKLKETLLGDKIEVDIDEINKLIFELMLYFQVPYRAICYRMGELLILAGDDVNALEQYERANKDKIKGELVKSVKYARLAEESHKKEFADINKLIENAEKNNLTFKTKIKNMKELFSDDVGRDKTAKTINFNDI